MLNTRIRKSFAAFALFVAASLLAGCITPKDKINKATLLETVDASEADLVRLIDNLAKVDSMFARVDLKFEDNSYAELGIAEKYKTADGEIVVQRPSDILLKVKVPIIKTDVAQMSSDGTHFRVAILQDGGSGKYKKFIKGTNDADYSALQEKVEEMGNDGSAVKRSVNAFLNLRPQHFTDAMLVRPVDPGKYSYAVSTILEEEFDINAKKKSPLRWVLRGYYLYDEFGKTSDGKLKIKRRFWFDRVGSVRLARQQIFDDKGEIESDIVYGREGKVTESGAYTLPLEVELTRPKEKYKMRLIYQSPSKIIIGNVFPQEAFVLKNVWGLPVLDLDQQLKELNTAKQKKKTEETEKTGRQ